MKSKTLLFILFTSLFLVASTQNIIHVPGDQPSIQAGINAADSGDVVLVADSTYYENIDFKGKAITVTSNYHPVNNPDSSYIYNTIIDGSQPAFPDSATVVYFISGEDTTSVIRGFTIRGGSGTNVFGDLGGGGILCYASGAKIIHNRIVNNHLSDSTSSGYDYISGGGIYGYDNLLQHYLVIRHNTIDSNSCLRYEAGTASASGGGISAVYYKECIIYSNDISNNIAFNDVAGLYSMGGGIELYNVKGFVYDNHISDNEIVSTSQQYIIWGAGMYCYSLKEGSIISNNTFQGNTADALYSKAGGLGIGSCQDDVLIDGNLIVGNSALWGGGMALGGTTGVTTYITNNVIRGNYAQQKNGGLRIQGSFKGSSEFPKDMRGPLSDDEGNNARSSGAIVLANNTFYENDELWATAAEVEVLSDNVPLVAFNNIFYNTTGSIFDIRLAEGSMSYFYYNILDTNRICLSGAQWEGDDNFYEDPMLMEDSIHLLDESPCIDMGVNSLEVDGDIYFCPEKDIDGGWRPQCGTADIGADEIICVGIPQSEKKDGIEIIAYPNPVNGYADIRYSISDIRYSNLSIFDAFGRLIETLVDEVQQAGEYTVTWNAENLPSGIYFYRLMVGNDIASGKIIVK